MSKEHVDAALGVLTLSVMTYPCVEFDLDLTAVSFVYLAVIVGMAQRGRFPTSLGLTAFASGLLCWFFVPPIWTFWIKDPMDVVALSGFMCVSLMACRFVGKPVGRGKNQALVPIAAPIDAMPIYRIDESAQRSGGRSAPMIDPPPTRIAVLVEEGKVEKVVAAEGQADVMVVDLDSVPSDAIDFETMEAMLTWCRVHPDPKAMGKVQDKVVKHFIDRGMQL